MNVAQNLVNSARTCPDKKAIRFEGAEITYRELDIQCNHLANALRDLGLAPGDHCLVMMPNSIEIVIVYFALAKMGVVQMTVNPLERFSTLAYIVSEAKPKAFIGAEPHLDEIRRVFKSVDGPAIRLATGVSANSEFIDLTMAYSARPEYPLFHPDSGDVVNVFYSGKSPGVVRKVQLTHTTIFTHTKAIADAWEEEEHETVVIVALPLYRMFGIVSVLNASVYRGLTIELLARFDPERVVEMIARRRQTLLFVCSAMIGPLIEAAGRRHIQNSLKYCVSEGKALPDKMVQRFNELFGVRIVERCGGETL